MNTILKRILGASLALAAFSFITPSHVLAQTCVTPPTCDSLGFTKTTEDCVGKTILKCPFDLTKVYCPGADEQGDSPFVSTWEVGSSVMYNGKEIGIIFQDNGASVSIFSKNSSTYYCNTAKAQCDAVTTYDNIWHLPQDIVKAKALANFLRIPIMYEGGTCDSRKVFYCNPNGACDMTYGMKIWNYACIAEIPAPVNR